MANDLNALAPQSVTVCFSTEQGGVPDGTLTPYVVTLLSLALPEYGPTAGFPDTKLFHSTAPANFQGGVSAVNDAELTSLANAIARDYYLWLLPKLDQKFIGDAVWAPEGGHDIEWQQIGQREMSTRVRRGPFDESVEELFHFSPTYGSVDQECPCGTILTGPCPPSNFKPPRPNTIIICDHRIWIWINNTWEEFIDIGTLLTGPQACFNISRACVTISGGVITNTIEYQEICLPKLFVTFGRRWCVTNPLDCCIGTSSGSAGSGAPCVQVACCPNNDLPLSIRVTDQATGNAATLTFIGNYSNYPAPGVWLGTLFIGGQCGTAYLVFYCNPITGQFQLDIAWNPITGFSDPGLFTTINAYLEQCSNPAFAYFQTPPVPGGPGGGGGALPCPACNAQTPATWTVPANAGFQGCYSIFNNGFTLTQSTACTWKYTGANGTRVILRVAQGGDGVVLSFQAPPVGIQDGAAANYQKTPFSGDCCSPLTVPLLSSSCNHTGGGPPSTVPASVTITPNCVGTACPARQLQVTWTPCIPGSSSSGGGGNTVIVVCCPNAVPQTVTVSFSAGGGCLLNGATAVLTWDPNNRWWLGNDNSPCAMTWQLICGGSSQWFMDAYTNFGQQNQVNCGFTYPGTPTALCGPPLLIQFNNATVMGPGGCCDSCVGIQITATVMG